MQGRIIFLLEENSMKVLLDNLLPRLFQGWTEGIHFQCVPHEGKSDLDRSIRLKLRNWSYPNDRFAIVRDNDNANCRELKLKLIDLCQKNYRPDTLIRLVCQELESWYIGDLSALAPAFKTEKINSPAQQKRYINPDSWQKPSAELIRLVPKFQKVSGARAMASHLNPANNRSHSFRVFVEGVRQTAAEMGYSDIRQ